MIASSKNYILCIQLSDSHLFADTKKELLGIPTADSLSSVISLIQKEHPEVDLVLATGDISQDGSVNSYRLFQEQIDRLKAPSLWMQGNHDNFACIEDIPNFQKNLVKQQNFGKFWRIVTLNSQVPGKNHGKLSADELQTLSCSLQNYPDRFHLICLHHPAFSCTNEWLNEIKLQDSWEFLDVLEPFLNANVVLCGHIHQEFEIYYRGTYLFATPSTCLQFAPHSDEFKIDMLAPSYRWIKLFDDGTIDTGVSRLETCEYQIHTEATNY